MRLTSVDGFQRGGVEWSSRKRKGTTGLRVTARGGTQTRGKESPTTRRGRNKGDDVKNSIVAIDTNVTDQREKINHRVRRGESKRQEGLAGKTGDVIPLYRDDHTKTAHQQVGPKLVRIADVQRENVAWLWFPYIPRGKLTIIEGDPGIGKSFITMSLASDLSRGRPLWGLESGQRPPQTVLLLSAEDGLGDTIRPRLEAMDANLDEIVAFDEPFNLDGSGFYALEEAIRSNKPAIVIIDPLVAYTSGTIDMHRANQVRDFMKPLAHLAEKYDCALVVVRHLKKGSGGGKALYQGLGSIDYTAAARSVLMVGINKDGKRVMAHVKSNLAKQGATLAYELRDNGSFQWLGTDQTTAEELVAEPEDPEVRSARQEAREWLCERLAGGDWVPSKILERELDGLDFSMSSYKRARHDLKREGRLSVEQKVELGDGWFVCLSPAQSVNSQGLRP